MPQALIVDDNKQMAESIARMVRMLDWEAQAVFSSRTALEAILRLRPRLVLLDLNMPGVDGAEVLSYIKRDPMLTNTSVVFVSVEDDPVIQKKLCDAGAMDYLKKPFDFDRLESVLIAVQAEG